MQRPELIALVTSAIAAVTAKKDLSEATRLFSDAGLESIDIVDVLFEVEKSLPKKISLLQAFQVTGRAPGRGELTIGALVDFIETQLK